MPKIELIRGPRDGEVWDIQELIPKLFVPLRADEETGQMIEAVYNRTNKKTSKGFLRYNYEDVQTES